MPSLRFANDAEWHSLRDSHIGGSDVASLFNVWRFPDGIERTLHAFEAPPEGALHIECVSPYKSSFALWQEKAGKLPSDFAETERMIAGSHLEPALASWSQQVWPEWKLRKVRRYLQHDGHPGWGCSRDYEVIAPGHPPVEFKNVDWLIYRDKWAGGGEDLTPPLHISLQLQSQIGAGSASCDHGWVVVCVGGNKLERVKVPRHEPTQQRIAEAVDMFWASIEAGTPPSWLADADTVARLASVGPFDDDRAPAVDLDAIDDAGPRDLRRYLRWKRHRDFVDRQLDGMKARLGLRMVNSARATSASGTITWPVINRPAKMIPERWQDEKTYRGGFTAKPPKENN